MKKIYEKPSMVVEKFEVEDVITAASTQQSLFKDQRTLFGVTVPSLTIGEDALHTIRYQDFIK